MSTYPRTVPEYEEHITGVLFATILAAMGLLLTDSTPGVSDAAKLEAAQEHTVIGSAVQLTSVQPHPELFV